MASALACHGVNEHQCSLPTLAQGLKGRLPAGHLCRNETRQYGPNSSSSASSSASSGSARIKDVWSWNLDEAFDEIKELVDDFPYVSIDTEFPGRVVHPVGQYYSRTEFKYDELKNNVNMLKIIQLGLTFSDSRGQYPTGVCCYQFNFQWDIDNDCFAQDSIDLLSGAGLDWSRHKGEGINVQDFGERFMTSGLILNDSIKFISFHGMYDFAYLLKVCTCTNIPSDLETFTEELSLYFPNLCDIKFLIRNYFRGSLTQISNLLGATREGVAHQAGSDSLLTADVFFCLNNNYFDDDARRTLFNCKFFGLNMNEVQSSNGSIDSAAADVVECANYAPMQQTASALS